MNEVADRLTDWVDRADWAVWTFETKQGTQSFQFF